MTASVAPAAASNFPDLSAVFAKDDAAAAGSPFGDFWAVLTQIADATGEQPVPSAASPWPFSGNTTDVSNSAQSEMPPSPFTQAAALQIWGLTPNDSGNPADANSDNSNSGGAFPQAANEPNPAPPPPPGLDETIPLSGIASAADPNTGNPAPQIPAILFLQQPRQTPAPALNGNATPTDEGAKPSPVADAQDIGSGVPGTNGKALAAAAASPSEASSQTSEPPPSSAPQSVPNVQTRPAKDAPKPQSDKPDDGANIVAQDANAAPVFVPVPQAAPIQLFVFTGLSAATPDNAVTIDANSQTAGTAPPPPQPFASPAPNQAGDPNQAGELNQTSAPKPAAPDATTFDDPNRPVTPSNTLPATEQPPRAAANNNNPPPPSPAPPGRFAPLNISAQIEAALTAPAPLTAPPKPASTAITANAAPAENAAKTTDAANSTDNPSAAPPAQAAPQASRSAPKDAATNGIIASGPDQSPAPVPQTAHDNPPPIAAPNTPGTIQPAHTTPQIASITTDSGASVSGLSMMTMPQPNDAPVHLTLNTVAGLPDAAQDMGALALRIAAKSQDGDSNFQIRLDPPDLGRIDVNLKLDSAGNAHASLSADNQQTLDLLQRDAPALEKALKDAGLALQGGLSFSLKGDGKPGAWRDTQSGARERSLQIASIDAAGASTAALASSLQAYASANTRLDIRV